MFLCPLFLYQFLAILLCRGFFLHPSHSSFISIYNLSISNLFSFCPLYYIFCQTCLHIFFSFLFSFFLSLGLWEHIPCSFVRCLDLSNTTRPKTSTTSQLLLINDFILIWQENYINYRPSSVGKDDNGIKRMSLIARAAESIGDGDIFNVQIRRYRQWQLSQSSSLASCIIPYVPLIQLLQLQEFVTWSLFWNIIGVQLFIYWFISGYNQCRVIAWAEGNTWTGKGCLFGKLYDRFCILGLWNSLLYARDNLSVVEFVNC